MEEIGLVTNGQGWNENSEKIEPEKFVGIKKSRRNKRQRMKAAVERMKKEEDLKQERGLILNVQVQDNNSEKIEPGKDLVKKKKKKTQSQRKKSRSGEEEKRGRPY